MPIYEYECEGGHRFEGVRSIGERLKVVCPECKHTVHIIPSLTTTRMAMPFTVIGHDGTVLSSRQTTERTPLKVRKHSGKIVNY